MEKADPAEGGTCVLGAAATWESEYLLEGGGGYPMGSSGLRAGDDFVEEEVDLVGSGGPRGGGGQGVWQKRISSAAATEDSG